MNYFVYMVRCADTTFYVGITTDLSRRIDEHNGIKKGGARYTRAKRPVSLCYKMQYPSRSEASRQEYLLKQLSHTQKEELCKQFILD